MAPRFLRQWLSLAIVLALALGPVVQALESVRMAVTMTAAAASSAGASDDCGGCAGGDAAMTPGACVASCAPLLAVLPQSTAVATVAAARPVPAVMPSAIGYASPPDPHPPRPSSQG
jgi:hypothetical protein